MGLSNDGGVSKFPPGNPGLGQTTGPNSSLQEAWFHILDRYAVDTPLSEVIFPLMRNCFFGGAMHAVFLLQNGHGDQLASDIAGFIAEEPQSCAFAQEGKGFFIVLGLDDDKPLFNVATGNGTTGLGIPLNMVVGKVDEDSDLISLLDRLPAL